MNLLFVCLDVDSNVSTHWEFARSMSLRYGVIFWEI